MLNYPKYVGTLSIILCDNIKWKQAPFRQLAVYLLLSVTRLPLGAYLFDDSSLLDQSLFKCIYLISMNYL